MRGLHTAFTDDDLIPILLFTVLAAFACLLPAQNDTFLHLRSGLHMWQTGAFIVTEPFSHTAYGLELHNHWWLTQLLFYGVYSLGGPFLLTVLAGACALAAVAGSWRLTRGAWEVRVGLLAWLVLATAPSWSLRPQVISLALLVVVVHLIARNRLGWVPLVCVLWANAHGLVIFGVAMSGAALLEAVLWSRADIRRTAAVAAACFAAPMVSPVGWSYWPQILSTVSMARELQIQEYLMPLRASNLPFWVGLIALVALTIQQRQRLSALSRSDRVLLLGALGLAVAGVSAARNGAFFAVVAAPALSRLWAMREVAPARLRRPRPLGAPALVLCVLVAAGSALLVFGRWRQAGDALGWQPVSEQALASLRQCPHPLFNEMRDGGFLIWALAERKVFVDGRMEAYPIDVMRASRRADVYGEYKSTFDQWGINCALVTRGSPLHANLTRDREMTLAYSDSARSVFVRSGSGLAAR